MFGLLVIGGLIAALNSGVQQPLALVQLGVAAAALVTSFINNPVPAKPASAHSPMAIVSPALAAEQGGGAGQDSIGRQLSQRHRDRFGVEAGRRCTQGRREAATGAGAGIVSRQRNCGVPINRGSASRRCNRPVLPDPHGTFWTWACQPVGRGLQCRRSRWPCGRDRHELSRRWRAVGLRLTHRPRRSRRLGRRWAAARARAWNQNVMHA